MTFSIDKRLLTAVLAAALSAAAFADTAAMPSSVARYATDAYPGFGGGDEVVTSRKKTPRWLSWCYGPSKTNAVEQLAHARALEKKEKWSSARGAYDALVREWPASPEAPKAQEALARICLEKCRDLQDAFSEYKYLLDYYPSACDFDAAAAKLYDVAKARREKGKRWMGIRFADTADVRRAFEAVVLRAPGASYAPEAMLAVASLREDEGEHDKAVMVYENLRSLYASSPEAKTALWREGAARMALLRVHGYNRTRCRDTVAYLRRAAPAAEEGSEAKADLTKWLAEATALVEDEDWEAAKFYDSKTRTRHSAISAYQKFAAEHPASERAREARARIEELKGGAR